MERHGVRDGAAEYNKKAGSKQNIMIPFSVETTKVDIV